MKQGDLFAPEAEPEPSGESYRQPVYHPDPVRIRARLHEILGEARAAERLPWDRARTELYRLIVPQMSAALPEDEAGRLIAEFEAELARLEAVSPTRGSTPPSSGRSPA